MRRYISALLCALLSIAAVSAQTTRQERRLITSGNNLYLEGKYFEALGEYQKALAANPQSAEARYNSGLSRVRLASKASDNKEEAEEVLKQAVADLTAVAGLTSQKPMLASKANYNLGNLSFNSEDYQNALNFYKQALRLNPADDDARRNLRITQKRLQQNQDKKQDQNKDQNQDQNKDQNQDQNKDQNQDQNKDQNKDQNQDKNQQQQQQPQQQQQQQQQMSQQNAEQILKAMENKENATRARVGQAGTGEKGGRQKNRRNW